MEPCEYTKATINKIADKKNPTYPASSHYFISVLSMCRSHEELLSNLDQFIVQRFSNDTTEERLRVIQYSVHKESLNHQEVAD